MKRLIDRKSCAAFSLTELLVALVIVSALLALLLPVLLNARQAAKSTTCIAKLKNLWSDWDAYRREKRNLLYAGANTWVAEMYYANALHTADETTCPATNAQSPDVYFYPTPFSGPSGGVRVWSGPPPKPIGYSVNNWVFYSNYAVKSALSAIKQTTTPLFMDGKVYGMAPGAWDDPNLRRTRIAFRHNGNANFVFLDGHAESLSPEQVAKLDPKPF